VARAEPPKTAAEDGDVGFEKLEPWPDAVDGAALLDEIVAPFRTYLVLPDGGAELLALWVAHAYALDAFEVSPILNLGSAEKSCGKTTTLRVIECVAPRPWSLSDPTNAVLYRVIQDFRPTLLCDESDNIVWHERQELLALINSGYGRGGAFIWRCEGDDHTPTAFSTWTPKVFAGLKPLPETLLGDLRVLFEEKGGGSAPDYRDP
jgi:putative DNA primase/helicase